MARRSIRFQLIRVRWLRRSSATCQSLVTWVRKAATAARLPGTALAEFVPDLHVHEHAFGAGYRASGHYTPATP